MTISHLIFKLQNVYSFSERETVCLSDEFFLSTKVEIILFRSVFFRHESYLSPYLFLLIER